MMRTRLEGYDNGRTNCPWPGIGERRRLGVDGSGTDVSAFRHDLPIRGKHDGTDSRIRMRHRANGESNGTAHHLIRAVRREQIVLNAARHTPSFSHPDCHRRSRNFTGSTLERVRGLSPPVGNRTLP